MDGSLRATDVIDVVDNIITRQDNLRNQVPQRDVQQSAVWSAGLEIIDVWL
jgi:hypothetical protein